MSEPEIHDIRDFRFAALSSYGPRYETSRRDFKEYRLIMYRDPLSNAMSASSPMVFIHGATIDTLLYIYRSIDIASVLAGPMEKLK